MQMQVNFETVAEILEFANLFNQTGVTSPIINLGNGRCMCNGQECVPQMIQPCVCNKVDEDSDGNCICECNGQLVKCNGQVCDCGNGQFCGVVDDTKVDGDTESKEEPKTEDKPKPKRKPRKKKVEAKVEEPVEEKVEDNLPPTFKGEEIVDEKPEVATETVDIEKADAPKLFHTVMTVNDTVRALMMSGTITAQGIQGIAVKLPEVNSFLFNKYEASTINDKATVETEIATLINNGEILALMG